MANTYPDQQRTLGSLLRLPYQELQDAVYGALASHGFADLRTAHSAVFRHLDPDGTRLTTLAERAGMTKQSMAYLVDALTESGYLTTAADPHDGRAVLVRPTEAGRAVVLDRRADRVARISPLLDRLTAAEREALAAALPVLERLATLEQPGEGTPSP